MSRTTTYVITEWDGTEEVVEVLEGPVPEMEMGSDDVRILYSNGTCHEVKRGYFNQLKPMPVQ